MRRKARVPSGQVRCRLDRIRTVRAFDDAYTAPYFGFASAATTTTAPPRMRVVDSIQLPALIITAADDPFVPVESFRDPKIAANPNITLVVTRHGGHCGFLGERDGAGDDGYWAERTVVEFAASPLTNDE